MAEKGSGMDEGLIDRIASALERQCEQHDESVARQTKNRQDDLARIKSEHDRMFAESRKVNDDLMLRLDAALLEIRVFKQRLEDIENAVARLLGRPSGGA